MNRLIVVPLPCTPVGLADAPRPLPKKELEELALRLAPFLSGWQTHLLCPTGDEAERQARFLLFKLGLTQFEPTRFLDAGARPNNWRRLCQHFRTAPSIVAEAILVLAHSEDAIGLPAYFAAHGLQQPIDNVEEVRPAIVQVVLCERRLVIPIPTFKSVERLTA